MSTEITAWELANYFLVVADVVRWAKARGIRCQGRGSAANSVVAYLLEVSSIDSLAYDLVFERFPSPERDIPPDIDIDFATDRREEVIQYLYSKYGAEHIAMAATVVTFQARAALRYDEAELDLPAAPDEVQPPPLSATEEWGWEQVWGLSTKAHLLSRWRAALDAQGYLRSDALVEAGQGECGRVTGRLVVHQAPPTAKKTHFLTLEDEAGLVNVIVRSEVYAAHRHAIRGSALLYVQGSVQQREAAMETP